jgi:hypothetical protein
MNHEDNDDASDEVVTEDDIIRGLRGNPRGRFLCAGLGEFMILIATARQTWRLCGGDLEVMKASFAPTTIELAKLDAADLMVALVTEKTIYPPVSED